jgi:hypothetical protein
MKPMKRPTEGFHVKNCIKLKKSFYKYLYGYATIDNIYANIPYI